MSEELFLPLRMRAFLMDSLESALGYLDLGWSIIPLVPNAKTPNSSVLRRCGGTGKWEQFQKRPPTPGEVISWFEVDPTCGIGIVMGEVSGVVVADFDQGGWPPIDTAQVSTRRGVHLYLATGSLVPGRSLDWGELKGEGGYVVAPPSVHESGHIYEWLRTPESGLVAFEDMIDRLEIPPRQERGPRVSGRRSGLLSVVASKLVPQPRLTQEEIEYLRLHLPKGQRRAAGYGEIEHGIICWMLIQGYPPSEIVAWFLAEIPPKFEERGIDWLMFSIENAIETDGSESLRESGDQPPSSSSPSSSLTTHPSLCRESGHIDQETVEEESEQAKGRPLGWQSRRWLILRDGPEGLRVGELESYIKETFGIARTQATRDLAWLFEGGWLEATRSMADERVKIVVRTEKAKQKLVDWAGRLGTPLTFLIGLPTQRTCDETPPCSVSEIKASAPTPAQKKVPRPGGGSKTGERRETRVGSESAELLRRERALINDTFRIHFAGRPPTYIQLLTPPQEFVTALFHEQLQTGRDESGLIVRQSFVSPRDPSLGGSDANDPITERVLSDGGYPPSERIFGWAAQLEKTKAGFRVATRIENGEEVENIGLIVQAAWNFLLPLSRIPETPSKVIKVVRKSKEKKTKYGTKKTYYRCEAAGDALDLHYETPDLNAILEALASSELANDVLASLSEGWRLVKELPWQDQRLQPQSLSALSNASGTPQERS